MPKRKEDPIKHCLHCGKRFYRSRSVSGREEDAARFATRKYCSVGCSKQHTCFVSKPRPDRKTGKIISCQQCGKEFYIRKYQIGTTKFCSRKCKGLSSRRASLICPSCGKVFWPRDDHNPKRKYCSRECAGVGRTTGKIIMCDYCGKKVYKYRVFLKKSKNYFCSIECANAYQGRNKVEYQCKICGESFRLSPSVAGGQRKNPTYCSIVCRNKDSKRLQEIAIYANLVQLQEKGRNKLEQAGYEILVEIGTPFEEQVLIGCKFLVDVMITSANIIIQWDGDYWHCHPRFSNPDSRQIRRKRIDKSQNAYFKKCGYMLLRFWESDVKSRPEWVKQQIVKAINADHTTTIQRSA